MNRGRLFAASCVALVTTSMVFSIRGDILDALGADFHLTKLQTGVLLSPAFWGFTLSILIGGSLVDFFGMRRLLMLSGFGYIVAILAILFAPDPRRPGVALLFRPRLHCALRGDADVGALARSGRGRHQSALLDAFSDRKNPPHEHAARLVAGRA